MRRWLARLSFSFLIIALFLGWEAYQGLSGRVAMSQGRIMLYVLTAGMALAMSAAGIRERHHRS